jgi:hypothetical protein
MAYKYQVKNIVIQIPSEKHSVPLFITFSRIHLFGCIQFLFFVPPLLLSLVVVLVLVVVLLVLWFSCLVVVLSCLVESYLALPCLVLSCLVLSCRRSSFLGVVLSSFGCLCLCLVLMRVVFFLSCLPYLVSFSSRLILRLVALFFFLLFSLNGLCYLVFVFFATSSLMLSCVLLFCFVMCCCLVVVFCFLFFEVFCGSLVLSCLVISKPTP